MVKLRIYLALRFKEISDHETIMPVILIAYKLGPYRETSGNHNYQDRLAFIFPFFFLGSNARITVVIASDPKARLKDPKAIH